MANEKVSINVTWVSLLVSVLTLFTGIASATWWISGVRSEQVLSAWEKTNAEKIEQSLKDPNVPLSVALYISQHTVTKEDWKEFKSDIDDRLASIQEMLRVIGADYANKHTPTKKSGG